MRLKAVTKILLCEECRKYAAIPESIPIACGNSSANILILTQDPNRSTQEEMNAKQDPEIIFSEENEFAPRISEYLLGKGDYSPYNNSIKKEFNPDNICWIHSANVFCADNKSQKQNAIKHTSHTHLPEAIEEIKTNSIKGMLFIVVGGNALSCVLGKKAVSVNDYLDKPPVLDYLRTQDCCMVGYHPSPEARSVWNSKFKTYEIAQEQVRKIRAKVKQYLQAKG